LKVAGHSEQHRAGNEKLELASGGKSAMILFAGLGVTGLAAAVFLGMSVGDDMRRFYFSYLVAFAFFLALSLGGLFFVLIQHLTKSGWSVTVRRVAESFASAMPIMLLLSIPILVSVLLGGGKLYRWAWWEHADHGHAAHTTASVDAHAGKGVEATRVDPATGVRGIVTDAVLSRPGNVLRQSMLYPPPPNIHPSANGPPKPDYMAEAKRPMLNPLWFSIRIALFIVIWSAIALRFHAVSRRQDSTGDGSLSDMMQKHSALCMIVFALTVTLAVFDLIMSLDHHWYSTIFGVYFFSGAMLTFFSMMVLTLVQLQSRGYLTESVTKEHYHDLGKFMFGFTFFFGYIAFSQFMLLWYASIPEIMGWLARRGATTAVADQALYWHWSIVAMMVLFGKILIPFAGLMSRHVKRNKYTLAFWAVWVLAFQYVDLFWLVMPEYNGTLPLGVADIGLYVATFVGVGGIFMAMFVWRLGSASLRPTRDPLLHESLAFTNI
jgi:hypothetical protein